MTVEELIKAHAGTAFDQPQYMARYWFAVGQAEMAREFAAGKGATLAKLEEIAQAIRAGTEPRPQRVV